MHLLIELVEVNDGVGHSTGRQGTHRVLRVSMAIPGRQSTGVGATEGDPGNRSGRGDVRLIKTSKLGKIGQGLFHSQELVVLCRGTTLGNRLAIESVLQGHQQGLILGTQGGNVASGRSVAGSLTGDKEKYRSTARSPVLIVHVISLSKGSVICGVEVIKIRGVDQRLGCLENSIGLHASKVFLVSKATSRSLRKILERRA